MSRKRQSRKSKRPRSTTAATSGSRASRAALEEFNPDYSQTIKDLKRIGILASTFFVILVALSFFLR